MTVGWRVPPLLRPRGLGALTVAGVNVEHGLGFDSPSQQGGSNGSLAFYIQPINSYCYSSPYFILSCLDNTLSNSFSFKY